MNAAGGPVLRDPITEMTERQAPDPSDLSIPILDGTTETIHSATRAAEKSAYNYTFAAGFLDAGNDLGSVFVNSAQDALALCTTTIRCQGIT